MLGIVGIPEAPAQEGDGTIVSSASASVATDVINGTVLAIQSVDTGTEVHSLALVRVDQAVEGTLSGDIFVEVPGGTSAGGLNVVVSHQPSFRVSDVVQLALTRATAEEEAVLTGSAAAVYSVVGGTEGAAAVSGSLLSQANASGDFTLTGSKWNPNDSSRWPIPYKINTTNTGLSPADTIAALQGGFQQWVDDAATDIEFNYQGTTTTSPSNYNDGTNTVGWIDTPNVADQFLAQAVWVSSQGTTLAFDIRFNRDYQWAWGAQSGHFDVETVQLHEAGHALGLGHTTASTAEVMYPSISSNTTKGLGAGDLSGVAGLYPAANPPAPGGGDGTCNGLAATIDMNTNGGNGTGTAGDDVILGTPGADQIDGLGGNDVICGGAGADVLLGGEGDDQLFGDDGSDALHGQSGADSLYGGTGNDLMWGYDGADLLEGGDGDDTMQGNAGPDAMNGGPGVDYMHGQGGIDTMDGGTGGDFLWGYDGDDILKGGDGNDVLQGMSGRNRIEGQLGSDTLIGGNEGDLLYGGDGIDVIWGLGGNDWIEGGPGNDVLLAGDGVDTALGGPGVDNILGDAGDDTLYGDAGIDLLWGGSGVDTLYGGDSNDILQGGSGPDRLEGQAGSDTIIGDGGADYLIGGPGADVLWGSADNDTLSGDAGADTLIGGAGVDTCSGGAELDASAGCEPFIQ